tara:strand:- start:19 stop:432 length:414 start_codon:yes stop_codon:yes gene_type:complete
MKFLTALTALTFLAAPAQAFGTIPCNGANSGFIQVGSQVACFRQLSEQELQASREHAQRVAAQRREAEAERRAIQAARNAESLRQQNIRSARRNKDQAEDLMDKAADRILEPGGRKRYRRALELYTDSSVMLDQLER